MQPQVGMKHTKKMKPPPSGDHQTSSIFSRGQVPWLKSGDHHLRCKNTQELMGGINYQPQVVDFFHQQDVNGTVLLV